MEETYQNPEHVASFGGVDALYRAAHKKIKKKDIKQWLESVDAYTLHKPIRRKFKTNRVIVYNIDQQWQADLVDVTNLQKFNGGHRYILTCIDILSKYAWAIPLKQKRGEDITQAFKTIFQERKPKSLQTDRGKEFTNFRFQKFLKENDVRFFTSFNETKASVVERFNRTLKTKMWKYFTAKNTYNYVSVLQKLLSSYNNTYHSSIKISPIDVNKENESDVWFTLYGNLSPPSKCSYQVGDIVRISKHKLTFEKGYTSNWSEELFKITECVKRSPAVYRITDLLGESIEGSFYPQEIQKVKLKDTFPIEKIMKKRYKKGHMEYYVKYQGYSEKFNQWIPSTSLTEV